ncbi:ATP-binding protein [Micromonospora sp. BQ11]|uniref:ATP-binding protein n=1 Tax=Micromonospora sp. BQ11 TaxID=3452212 RepID=UPI003F8C74A3
MAERKKILSLVLASVGSVGLVGLTLFLTVGRLDAADKWASVVSAIVGVLSLCASAVVLQQRKRGSPVAADASHQVSDPAAVQSTNVAVPAVLRTLPRAVSDFTGRRQEVDALVKAVRDGAGSGLSVHVVDGMPGVGKTALVVQVAHMVADRYRDGQLFVRLHAHSPERSRADPCEVLGRLLVALGVSTEHVPATLDDRATMWRNYLARRRVLIVLDDAATHGQVEPFLPNSAGCLVLVTSRHRLTALSATGVLSLSPLSMEESRALFARVSQRAVGPEQAESVEQWVAFCGYLPLAICMVASQFRHHPSWQLGDRLHVMRAARDRSAVLRTEDITVSAVFELSYRDLPLSRQRLFRRISLHPGTDFDAGAVAALCDVPVEEAAEDLEMLSNEHLLQEPSAGRYRFHDLLRAYAQARAAEDPAAENRRAVRRLLHFYRDAVVRANDRIAAAHGPEKDGGDGGTASSGPGESVAWLTAEHANLLSCFRYAQDERLDDLVIDLAAALSRHLESAGPWERAADVHRAAVAAAERTGDHPAQAQAWSELGIILRLRGELEEASAVQQRAYEQFTALGDRQGQGYALNELGVLRRSAHEWTQAQAFLQRAYEAFDQVEDRRGAAYALHELGVVMRLEGRLAYAESCFSRALSMFESQGDRRGSGYAQHERGILHRLNGEYPQAKEAFTAAVGIFADLGNRSGEAWARHEWGVTCRHSGDNIDARSSLERAAAMFDELGDRCGRAWALHELGIVSRCLDDYMAAIRAHTDALGLFTTLGNADGCAYASQELGIAFRCTGDIDRAGLCFRRAAKAFAESGDRSGHAWALHESGITCRSEGDYAAAVSAHTAALAVFIELDDKRGEGWSLHELSISQRLLADYAAARKNRDRALSIFAMLGEQRGSGWAWHERGLEHGLLGDRRAAEDAQREALRIFVEIGDRCGEARVALARAQIMTRWIERRRAKRLYRLALSIAKDIGDEALTGEVRQAIRSPR